MTYDMSRLPMSVHHALHELAALKDGGPSVMEFAAQARRLDEMDAASRAMAKAEQEVGAGETPILTHTSNRFLMSLKATNLKPSALPQIVCSSSRITRRNVDSICSPVMA